MNEAVEAVQWMFGFTKKQAENYIADAEPEVVEEIVRGYRKQMSIQFNED